MADVLKVLEHRGLDGDVPILCTQRGNQAQRIVVGAVGGAEARHGDCDEIVSRQLQLGKRLMADQQSEGGIQSSGNAQHQTVQAGVGHTGNQTLYLKPEQVVEVSVGIGGILRQEGVLPHRTQQTFFARGLA